MLADQSAHVLPVRAGLAPETRRVRRVANRQLAAVEDLAAVQVRERYFGGWNEIEVPLAGDLEEVLLELRQLAGAGQRRGVRHKRRLDFAVAMLTRVQIEHEVDERAGEARARAAQHREARAGELRAALEIDDTERRPQIPVGLRLEVEGAKLA